MNKATNYDEQELIGQTISRIVDMQDHLWIETTTGRRFRIEPTIYDGVAIREIKPWAGA